MKKNKLTDFVEQQEILNNIQTSIKKLYAGDEELNNDEFLSKLTIKTLDVMNYIDSTIDNLLDDDNIKQVAIEYGTTVEDIIQDMMDILLASTIARQLMLIENLCNDQ